MESSNLLDWHLTPDGLQVYVGPADQRVRWVSTPRACPACGHRWMAVAPLDSVGIECPVCHEVDLWHRWQADDQEDQSDGC